MNIWINRGLVDRYFNLARNGRGDDVSFRQRFFWVVLVHSVIQPLDKIPLFTSNLQSGGWWTSIFDCKMSHRWSELINLIFVFTGSWWSSQTWSFKESDHQLMIIPNINLIFGYDVLPKLRAGPTGPNETLQVAVHLQELMPLGDLVQLVRWSFDYIYIYMYIYIYIFVYT